MWDYLKKYKNNHTTSSLPQTTRSNLQTYESGWKDLVPSTPSTGTALDLPWATTFSNTHSHPTMRKVHKTLLNSFPEWKNKLLPPQPVHTPCLWPHSHPKNLNMRSRNCSQTNHQAPLALPTECYQLVTLISKDWSSFFFNGLWEIHTQPSDWQLSLLQPIYKGHNKDKTDPASYRGIYLNDTLAKLFEGLLISRLTTHTELFNTLTNIQLGTKPDKQTHDAIYILCSPLFSTTNIP